MERGEKILLICNATGGTQIAEDIDWFKDGNIIDTSRRRRNDVMILKYRSLEEGALISRLQIDHADMDDAGTYVCRSSYNKLGDFSVNVLAGNIITCSLWVIKVRVAWREGRHYYGAIFREGS